MPRESGTLSIRIVNDIATVPAADWDACAGDNPFVRHAFLAALEASGSAQPETGWAPHHLVVEGAGGAVRAAAPMYLKSHSYGEYVFDHGWAQAYERAGGQYYPKLLIAAPFTPVTGPRLLVPPGEGAEAIEQALAAGAIEVARRFEVSSLHINFVAEAVTQRLTAHGFLVRTGEQFHWVNGGYADFDDFLTALASRKCKIIRRERRAALDDGVSVEILSGSAIAERHWDAFFRFYMDTGGRKWGRPYLNRAFFSMLGAGMADRIVLVLARRSGEYIAGAL
ncbi:MAG: GNAT family N-acetyltransferase, partial [Alphaproteobacteria bacterium]|nr:GNAT family N-acetyltransferase [Alphaproteobacteria bacterium]